MMAVAMNNHWRAVARAKDRLLFSLVNKDDLMGRGGIGKATLSNFVSISKARSPLGLPSIDTNRRHLIDLFGPHWRTNSSCTSDLRSPSSGGDGDDDNQVGGGHSSEQHTSTTGRKRLIPDQKAARGEQYENFSEVLREAKEQRGEQHQGVILGCCSQGIHQKRTFFYHSNGGGRGRDGSAGGGSRDDGEESSDIIEQPRVTLFNVSRDQQQQQQQRRQLQSKFSQVSNLRPNVAAAAAAVAISNGEVQQIQETRTFDRPTPQIGDQIGGQANGGSGSSNKNKNNNNSNRNVSDTTAATTTTTATIGSSGHSSRLNELARGHQETVKNYDLVLWQIARDYQQTDHYDHSLFGLDAHLDRAVARHQREAMLYNQVDDIMPKKTPPPPPVGSSPARQEYSASSSSSSRSHSSSQGTQQPQIQQQQQQQQQKLNPDGGVNLAAAPEELRPKSPKPLSGSIVIVPNVSRARSVINLTGNLNPISNTNTDSRSRSKSVSKEQLEFGPLFKSGKVQVLYRSPDSDSRNPIDRHLKEEQAKLVAPGTKQSPISIMTMNPTYELQNKPMIIDYPAMVENLRLDNTGFSWEVKIPYQISMTTAMHGAHLNTSYRYRLDQFHCHWGDTLDNGSEHTIDNRGYSAELHFVHYNMEKYHTFSKAARHSDGLVVLAVFIDAHESYHNHAELEKIVAHLKTVQLKGDHSIIRQAVRIENLLPANRSYWSYQGSLTTPPYFESVTWFILKQPIKCSLSQIQRFRSLKSSLRHDDGFYITSNHRKTQNLNGRTIVMYDEPIAQTNNNNDNDPSSTHHSSNDNENGSGLSYKSSSSH